MSSWDGLDDFAVGSLSISRETFKIPTVSYICDAMRAVVTRKAPDNCIGRSDFTHQLKTAPKVCDILRLFDRDYANTNINHDVGL